MPKITKVKTGNVFEDKESFSRLVIIDDWILMANTAGRNPRTKEMPTDAAGQARQAFDNVEAALRSVGSSLADVVRSRIFIPNPADVASVMAVVGERYRGIDPVSTVSCSPLGLPHLLFEVEVTAYRGASLLDQSRVTISL